MVLTTAPLLMENVLMAHNCMNHILQKKMLVDGLKKEGFPGQWAPRVAGGTKGREGCGKEQGCWEGSFASLSA